MGHPTFKYFAAGIAAGALAIGISLLIRSLTGAPFLPELASQTLFSLTPGEVESQAVQNFGPLAKYSAFMAAIVINFILYGLIGIIVDRIHDRFPWKGYSGKVLQSSSVAYIILLIISILLVTTIQLRTGSNTAPISHIVVSLILPQLIFGLVFASFFRSKRRTSRIERAAETMPETQRMGSSRRDFL